MKTPASDKVLVDTSVWIEFFRKRDPWYTFVTELIDTDRICCLGIILAELIQGARGEETETLRDFLYVFPFLEESRELWIHAGELSRDLRKKGQTVGLADCYIASAAHSGKAVLCSLDRHFSVIREEIELALLDSPRSDSGRSLKR